jgi:hypothetical protein
MNGNYFSNEHKLADEYETPSWLFDILNEKFKFEVDLACDSKNCKIPGSPLFDKGFNALEESWSQWKGMKYVFPPFSKPFFNQYLLKAHDEWRKGHSSVVMAPIKTISVNYFQPIKSPIIYIIYPRIRFYFNGRENHAAESVCLLVYTADKKENISPNIYFTDLKRYAPASYYRSHE